MIVRQAKAEDATQVARINVESWQTTYRGMFPDEVLDNLDIEERSVFWVNYINELADGTVLLVAEDDAGQVVGFASGQPNQGEFADSYGCDLQRIYLLESAQGQGIGRKLMEAFAQWAIEQGYHSMLLWSLAENTNSRAFYEHMGGILIMESKLTIAGHLMDTVSYGWSDLGMLT